MRTAVVAAAVAVVVIAATVVAIAVGGGDGTPAVAVPIIDDPSSGSITAPAPTEAGAEGSAASGSSPTTLASDLSETAPEPAVFSDPNETYDPVQAGEPIPPGYRQLLVRDGIAPIYDPSFVAAAEIDWSDGTLVIGLELDGDARAYPVAYLNRREMVIDSVAGIPVLVTW